MKRILRKKNKKTLKVKLSALIVVLTLFGCKTAQQHVEAAERHTLKAVKKGAVLLHRTDTLLVDNIISDTLTIRDTTFVTNTIERVVVEAGELRYMTRVDKRKESQLRKRIYKDSITIAKLIIRKNAKVGVVTKRQEERTDRVIVRQENRGSKWWLWLIIGFVLGFAARLAIKIFTKFI